MTAQSRWHFWGEIGERTSLRHAVQLLSPAGEHVSGSCLAYAKLVTDCAQHLRHTWVNVAPGVCLGMLSSVQSSSCRLAVSAT